jgi:hypothetical protein
MLEPAKINCCTIFEFEQATEAAFENFAGEATAHWWNGAELGIAGTVGCESDSEASEVMVWERLAARCA